MEPEVVGSGRRVGVEADHVSAVVRGQGRARKCERVNRLREGHGFLPPDENLEVGCGTLLEPRLHSNRTVGRWLEHHAGRDGDTITSTGRALERAHPPTLIDNVDP